MTTHRERFLERVGLPKTTSLSLEELAFITNYPEPYLKEVFDRGVGAWKTNIASVRLKKDFSKNPNTRKYPRNARLGPEQWAYARVYAFIMRSPTFYGPDSDIAREMGLLPEKSKG